jgi:hypothetical protein
MTYEVASNPNELISSQWVKHPFRISKHQEYGHSPTTTGVNNRVLLICCDHMSFSQDEIRFNHLPS